MAQLTINKMCAACGVDCSDRPRTKDTRGNYFCKPCFDDLLARKQRGEKIVLPRLGRSIAGPSPASVRDPLDALPMEEESLLSSLDLGASSTASGVPAPPSAEACSGCGAVLATGSVLCVNCGQRVGGRPGRHGALRTTIAAASRTQDGTGVGATIFGIGGLLVGSLGLLMSLMLLVAAVQSMGVSKVVGVASLSMTALYLWLGGLHLLGAIDTLRRCAIGPARLRLTSAIFLGLSVISTVAQVKLLSGEGAEEARGGLSVAALIGYSIVGLVIVNAWPIAVLAWTSLAQGRGAFRDWR